MSNPHRFEKKRSLLLLIGIGAALLLIALLVLSLGTQKDSKEISSPETSVSTTAEPETTPEAETPAAEPEAAPEAETPAAEPEAAPEAETPAAEPEAASEAEVSTDAITGDFRFSTTLIDGSSVDESLLLGNKVIMVNFWEPWCGPCVNEMPDLEKLYENYKEQGFLILGVYSTEDGTQDVVEALKITYPILRFSQDFMPYVSNYVPCTVFVDGQGNLLTPESIVGSRSYADWEGILLSLMD